MMIKTYLSVAAVLALSTGSVLAANPTAVLTIEQSDGTIWREDVSGLLKLDAQNNFSLIQGSTTAGLFQDGQFKQNADASHPDFWQWKTDATGAGYWNWHSAQTVSGSTASAPWMASLDLKNVSGHGDPDLSYAVSAVNNNSTRTQTYTFAVSESILPTVSGANAVYADIAGALVTRGGNVTIAPSLGNSAIQQFQLSSDNGASFVTAGVDVGPAKTTGATSTYGTFSAAAAGPTGQTWDYMQIVTKFTLTAGGSASLAGFASITPVPEPESYAMLLTGLGLLGLIARRRRNA